MAVYRDRLSGVLLDTNESVMTWVDAAYWDGSNNVSRATNSEWLEQRLHKTRKGTYWVETISRIEYRPNSGELVSPAEALAWLLQNGYAGDELPDDLRPLLPGVVA